MKTRIRSEGRRGERDRLEAPYTQKTFKTVEGMRFARIGPAVYDPVVGPAMRVDRSQFEKSKLVLRRAMSAGNESYIVAYPGALVTGPVETVLERATIFVARHRRPMMLYKVIEVGLVPVLPPELGPPVRHA